MSGWGQHASASEHRRYKAPVRKSSRKRCPCGCRQRATHLGMANGLALMYGCELRVRRWVKDWRSTSRTSTRQQSKEK